MLHGALEPVPFGRQLVDPIEQQLKLGFSYRRRTTGPLQRKYIPAQTSDVLTRALDLRTDGCNIRHGLTLPSLDGDNRT